MASADGEAEPYEIETYFKHLVHTYTGLNFKEIGDLNYIDYLRYRRDAFILRCSATEEGRAFLQDCKRMEVTTPDRASLRELVGEENVHGRKIT